MYYYYTTTKKLLCSVLHSQVAYIGTGGRVVSVRVKALFTCNYTSTFWSIFAVCWCWYMNNTTPMILETKRARGK